MTSNKSGKPTAAALRDLYRAIAELEDAEQAQRFFVDLCTPAELQAMADRWRVAQLVAREVPYRVVAERTGVSTATISRVVRALRLGAGGYRRALEKRGKS